LTFIEFVITIVWLDSIDSQSSPGSRNFHLRLEREYHIDQPLNLVWDSILNPDFLAEILPGCKTLTPLSDTKFSAEVEIKVGHVKGSYTSDLEISNIRPLEGYHFEVNGTSTNGGISGGGDISLEEEDGSTVLSFCAEGNVSGILARVGHRLIEAVGKKIIDQGFANFQTKLAEKEYA
jgi:carbon monoxide dehydrogenase subunit G